jgi:curved DNA-binding protein CbpA
MAKKHHPDVSSSKNAAEDFKLISKAYAMLCDPVTKQYHDQLLQQPPEPEPVPQPTRTRLSREDLLRRKAALDEMKLRKDMAYYIRDNNQLPYNYRIFGWIVAALFGWQLIYSHWFVNEDAFDHILAFAGGFAFLACSFGFLNVLYKKMRFDFYSGRKKWKFGARSYQIWAVFVLTGTLLLPVVNNYRYNYHLEHYGVTEFAKIGKRSLDKVVLVYQPESGRQIVKHKTLTDKNIILSPRKNQILIKYSRANPRIMELVERTD